MKYEKEKVKEKKKKGDFFSNRKKTEEKGNVFDQLPFSDLKQQPSKFVLLLISQVSK